MTDPAWASYLALMPTVLVYISLKVKQDLYCPKWFVWVFSFCNCPREWCGQEFVWCFAGQAGVWLCLHGAESRSVSSSARLPQQGVWQVGLAQFYKLSGHYLCSDGLIGPCRPLCCSTLGRIIKVSPEVLAYRDWTIKKWGAKQYAKLENHGNVWFWAGFSLGRCHGYQICIDSTHSLVLRSDKITLKSICPSGNLFII